MTTKTLTETGTAVAKNPECRSMTGYAMVRGDFHGWNVRVSVKSVNHRFLDVKLRIPESLEQFEHRLRQVVRGQIHRGHIDVHVSADPGGAAPVHVNRELLKKYVDAAKELRKQSKAKGELDVVSLLRLPGVITGLATVLPESDEEQEEFGNALERLLHEALGKMDEMRKVEGRHTAEELRARVDYIGEMVERVRELMTTVRPAFARRLEARLKDLLNGTSVEPSRLAQEAALLAERSDISEELDRLRSHLQQFTKLLDGAGELGKKLDFLLQEMHREANTMLSKTPGVESEALAITGLALEIKAEIEKLREQVQNIE
jgi:uncharacterized protein (TIGR00255 family)